MHSEYSAFEVNRKLMQTQLVAIIDIDCAELNGFDSEDQEALEALAELIAASSEF
jgi:L-methionine (R)-S-oxide reductase